MANIKATYGSQDITLGKWSKSVTPIVAENDQVTGEEVTFKVRGLVKATTKSNQATAISGLHTAFCTAGSDFKIWDGTTTIDSLTAANCTGGGPTISYDIPEDPLRAGYNTVVEITVKGTIAPVEPGGGSTNILASPYKYEYDHDAQDRITRTKTGTIRVSSSQDVDDYKDDVEPALTADAYLSAESDFEGYERISEKWTPDQDGLSADYSFTDRAYYKGIPDGVKDLKLSVSTSNDGNEIRVNIRGSCGGPSTTTIDALKGKIEAFIEEFRPDGAKLFKKRIDADEFSMRVNFDLELLATSGGGPQLSQKYSVESVVEHKWDFASYAGGGGGVAQKVASSMITTTFSGTSRALGDTPKIPAYSGSGKLIRQRQRALPPEKGLEDGAVIYETAFEKVWEDFAEGGGGSEGPGSSLGDIFASVQDNLRQIAGQWRG